MTSSTGRFNHTVKMQRHRVRGLGARRLAEQWLDRLADTTDPLEQTAIADLARNLCRLADRTRGARSQRGWL
jgi:truncated hemoglobin YjbI